MKSTPISALLRNRLPIFLPLSIIVAPILGALILNLMAITFTSKHPTSGTGDILRHMEGLFISVNFIVAFVAGTYYWLSYPTKPMFSRVSFCLIYSIISILTFLILSRFGFNIYIWTEWWVILIYYLLPCLGWVLLLESCIASLRQPSPQGFGIHITCLLIFSLIAGMQIRHGGIPGHPPFLGDINRFVANISYPLMGRWLFSHSCTLFSLLIILAASTMVLKSLWNFDQSKAPSQSEAPQEEAKE